MACFSEATFQAEFLIIGTYQQLKKIEIDSVRVEDIDISPVKSVCNTI